jgi:phage/conjugal plasmid C-4 type zinc finger TraR family protein
MTDDVDRASAREGELLAEALYQQARRAGLAGKTVADSAKRCHDCDAPIPKARRAAVPGCLYCVACQTAHEKERP